MSKEKGNHTAILNKARQYILELIETHNLNPPYHRINLRDKKLLQKYGLYNNYYRMKEILIEAGWIIDVGDYFHIGSKAIYYSLSNSFLLANKLLVSYDIDMIWPLNVFKINLETDQNTDIQEELVNSVKFGKVNIKDDYTDMEVLAALSVKYRQLPYYIMRMKSINEALSDNEFLQVKFMPTITRKNGKITKIGIRATSKFSNQPARKNHQEAKLGEVYREEILDYWFGKDNWVEYDIKGSVPRISRLINRTVIEDLHSDPYAQMFKSYFDMWEGGWDESKRKTMKQYFMRLYFDGSVGDIINHLNWTHNTNNYSIIKDPLTALKDIVVNYCGETNGTEVFLHESCIYMDVLYELLLRKIPCAQVYDAFYIQKDVFPNDIDDIVYKCMNEYVNKWC